MLCKKKKLFMYYWHSANLDDRRGKMHNFWERENHQIFSRTLNQLHLGLATLYPTHWHGCRFLLLASRTRFSRFGLQLNLLSIFLSDSYIYRRLFTSIYIPIRWNELPFALSSLNFFSCFSQSFNCCLTITWNWSWNVPCLILEAV